MSFWHAMLGSGIAGRPLDWTERPLAGDATLKLPSYFFEVKIDNAYSDVINACAKREDTWINREIIESYTRLHELGYAHSVEAWSSGKSASRTDSSCRTAGELAGGLYGVAIGGAFFG